MIIKYDFQKQHLSPDLNKFNMQGDDLVHENLLQHMDTKRLKIPTFNKAMLKLLHNKHRKMDYDYFGLFIIPPIDISMFRYNFNKISANIQIHSPTLFRMKKSPLIETNLFQIRPLSIHHHKHYVFLPRQSVNRIDYSLPLPRLTKLKAIKPTLTFELKYIEHSDKDAAHVMKNTDLVGLHNSLFINMRFYRYSGEYNMPNSTKIQKTYKLSIFKMKFAKVIKSSVYLKEDTNYYLQWLERPVYSKIQKTYLNRVMNTTKEVQSRTFKSMFKPLFRLSPNREQMECVWKFLPHITNNVPKVEFKGLILEVENKASMYFVKSDTLETILFKKASKLETDCYNILMIELSNVFTVSCTIKETQGRYRQGMLDVCKFLESILCMCIRTVVHRGLASLSYILISLAPFMTKIKILLSQFNNKKKQSQNPNLLSIIRNICFINKVIAASLEGCILKFKNATGKIILSTHDIEVLKLHDSYLVLVSLEPEINQTSMEELLIRNIKAIKNSGKLQCLFFKDNNVNGNIFDVPIFNEDKEDGLIVGSGSDLNNLVIVLNTKLILNNSMSFETLAEHIIKESIKYKRILILFVLENTTETTLKTVLGCKEFFLLAGIGLKCSVLFNVVLDCDVYEKEEVTLDNKIGFYNETELFNKEQIWYIVNQMSNKKLFEITMDEKVMILERYEITEEQLKMFRMLITSDINNKQM